MVKINKILNVIAILYSTYAVRLISWDRASNISGLSTEQIDGFDSVRGVCVRDGVSSRELSKRGETSEIEASGSGATVVVVSAAGVWGTVTIGSCGSCVWTAGSNLPGCAICAAGMVASLIAGAIACTVGNGCSGSGSVSANAKRDGILGITMHEKYHNGTHMLNHFTLDDYPEYRLYAAVGDNNKTRVVTHKTSDNMPDSVSAIMSTVDSESTKAKRDDNYYISWVSYEFDNQNVDLTREFSNGYETEPEFFSSHAAAALAAGGTTKYCMSLALGYDDNSYSNAIHGEMYTNNYGGVDGFCNQNDDDSHAEVDCNAHWYHDSGNFMEWGC